MSLYSRIILADSAALFWRLGTNGTTDQSGNGRDGTAGGGVTVGGAAALITDTDTATDFDGTDDRIASTYAMFGAGVWTFETWAWRDTDTAINTLLGSDGANQARLFIAASSTNVTFTPNSGVVGSMTWASAWPGNAQAVHAVMTFNPSTLVAELFINGASQGTKTLVGGHGATPGNFKLGARGALATDPFDGKLDEAAIYARALTLSEIKGHYATGLAVNAPVLPSFVHQAGRSQ